MYDDEFELTFDMAEDNAETVKLPGKPLQPAPEARRPRNRLERRKSRKSRISRTTNPPSSSRPGSRGRCPNRSGNLCGQSLCRSWSRRK